jgi:hypothetical protein
VAEWRADAAGFPPPAYPARRSRRPLVATAAAVVLAILGLALLWPSEPALDEEVAVATATPSTTTGAGPPPAPDPTAAEITTTTTPEPATTTTTVPAPVTTVATPVASTGPLLRLPATSLAFGATSTAEALEIANDGDAPLSWTAGASPDIFSVTPATGRVAPGATVRATVRLNRPAAAEGRVEGVVRVDSDGGRRDVRLTASVTHAPVVANVIIDNPRLARSPCSVDPTSAAVSATVTDETGVAAVVLRWRDATGAAGSRALVASRDGTYSGRLGPFTAPGTVTWWIEATDQLGATGRSSDRTATVAPC